jgi:hypothetical protein
MNECRMKIPDTLAPLAVTNGVLGDITNSSIHKILQEADKLNAKGAAVAVFKHAKTQALTVDVWLQQSRSHESMLRTRSCCAR